jgi:prolyl oligopeptidase
MPGVPDDYSLYVNSLENAVAGRGGWRRICGKGDNVTWFDWRGDDIYLLSFRNAPRFRVLHVTASAPAIENAREVVPQSSAVIEDIRAARDGLYLLDLNDGVRSVRRLAPDDRLSSIATPSDSSVSDLFADTGHDGIVAGVQSWVRPYTTYRTDGNGRVIPISLAQKPPFDVSRYESLEVLARAKDGVTVPLSIVYRKGTRRDGNAPTLLQAYGAYGINSVPTFRPEMIALLERGGVWATAHVRGGGERGQEWHEDGQLLKKPNTWGDLIACAEHLVAEKWTRPGKLGIRGRSAGGVAVGRAMTERPDLFAVVVSHVGMNNPLRFEFTPGGPGNAPEFGSLKTEDGFRGLYEMDTTVHVRRGVKYPAVLLTTGMHDPRVEPWEVAKLAAHLQAATASGKPVLLRVDETAGHGVGSTRRQQDEEFADTLAFFLAQTGSLRAIG